VLMSDDIMAEQIAMPCCTLGTFIPYDAFGTCIIVPHINDKLWRLVINYRPVTLSPVVSKVFVSALIIMYGMFLNVQCQNLVLRKILVATVLRNVIVYFSDRGCDVYFASAVSDFAENTCIKCFS